MSSLVMGPCEESSSLWEVQSELAQLVGLERAREQRHERPLGLPEQEGILLTFPASKDATSGPCELKLCLHLRSEKATHKLLQGLAYAAWL